MVPLPISSPYFLFYIPARVRRSRHYQIFATILTQTAAVAAAGAHYELESLFTSAGYSFVVFARKPSWQSVFYPLVSAVGLQEKSRLRLTVLISGVAEVDRRRKERLNALRDVSLSGCGKEGEYVERETFGRTTTDENRGRR